MGKIKFHGPFLDSLKSALKLYQIGAAVSCRHAMGKKNAPDWDVNIETGIRFWRHQFTYAMKHKDISHGRQRYNSLITETDDIYSVKVTQKDGGCWMMPDEIKGDAVLLYLHGGGYTFGGPISERFGEMLAHHTKTPVFMPYYRMTPEHAHPAQKEDALAAWYMVRKAVPDKKLIVIGDSAGGHMALTLLQSLKQHELPQPALCIGLCPWTDIGNRGKSLNENDHYDLVQGWMALKFGEWLDPDQKYGREALSPIYHDYKGLAPIYMQAGGREILRDMIIDFADIQAQNGADIMLDIWDDMPHNFQAYDSMKQSSTMALSRIDQMVQAFTSDEVQPSHLEKITRKTSGCFRKA